MLCVRSFHSSQRSAPAALKCLACKDRPAGEPDQRRIRELVVKLDFKKLARLLVNTSSLIPCLQKFPVLAPCADVDAGSWYSLCFSFEFFNVTPK